MKPTQAIKNAIDGNAILFIGSGFSVGAQNVLNLDFLSGTALSNNLCEELNIKEKMQLDIASDIYLEEKGEHNLITKLNNIYYAKKVTESQKTICSLPWKRIYTTNYDNVIELSSSLVSKRVSPVTINEDPSQHIGLKNICVHINGFIDQLTPSTLKNSFKLTTSSYMTDEFTNSKWGAVFRQDLNLAKAVIFIGYSLYDIDIQRIIISNTELKDKSIFIVGNDPTVSEKHIIKKFGRLVTGGLDKFSQTVIRTKDTYYKTPNKTYLYSFQETTVDEKRKNISDRALTNLLLLGNYNVNDIFSSITGETNRPYYIKRKEISSITQSISDGVKFFVIYSDLGNGKTLLTEGLSAQLIQMGYRIFRFKRYPEYTTKDIDQILNYEEKCLIIIENYHHNLEALELVGSRHIGNKVFLLTERTSLHEYYSEDLYRFIDQDKWKEYDCNKLELNEIDNAIEFVESAALWKDKTRWNLLQKRQFIQNKLSNEFQGILVDIVKSPDIHKRFQDIFNEISPGSNLHKVIITSLVLKTLNYSADPYILSDLIGVDSTDRVFRSTPENIKEFISFNNHGISIKSSVISRYILTNFSSIHIIVDLLIQIATKANELSRFNIIFKNLSRDLQRYGILQSILPQKKRRESLIDYFEAIKHIGNNTRNPYFWLQYGIARLSFKDYNISKNCFTTAYEISQNYQYFDTYQIDNHYARLIMESAIERNNKEECLEALREAHRLLIAQMNSTTNNKHYPFRVASTYYKIVQLFKHKLNKDEKNKILGYSKDIQKKIKTLPSNFIGNKYVHNCQRDMDKINSMLTSQST